MSRSEPISDECLSKLTVFDNWHTWHIKARMALQKMGLRYLLNDDGPEDLDVPDAVRRHETDQAAGVRLLVDGLSEDMLARAYASGWKPERATVSSTLQTLEAIVDEAQRRRREDVEMNAAGRRNLVNLMRADLAFGAQTVKEYILTAKHCHDGLLARYGGGDDSEELLEQLFVTALVEGLATSKPAWYAEWTEKLEQGTLDHEETRAGVTEWLLAKDRDDSKLAARPPPKGPAAAVTQAAQGSRAPIRAELADRAQEACSYCAAHHPKAHPHKERDCWFLKPHTAPPRWRDRNYDEMEAIKQGRRGQGKRKRTMSMSSPYA
ncbi:hypothetical protein BM221_001716 [Beauveria bassiana]|uniref:Uncharacterized protein n=1 Tax=Beauveria bassiana TaxID=176275 RepID=A0A2N6NWI0_BEABA|nr:hypothetical protein BM221_001716 [Beauveria bassiana]